eukprot:909957-Lingulodinium_polyedra.AAC.1
MAGDAEVASLSEVVASADAASEAAPPSTAAFEDFSTPFENRLAKFQDTAKDMTAAEMEPLLRRFFRESEISNYWNKIKRGGRRGPAR